jgi:hypothetical protein
MTTIELLRQFRLAGYAIFDFAASFLGIYLLSPWLSKVFLKLNLSIPKHNWLFLTLPLSVLVHLLVGQATQMTKDFTNLNSHYILKAVILGLLFLGLKGIKRLK